MRILHVISSVYKNGGGTSEVVPRLCRALHEAGEDVVLATLKDDEVSTATLDAMRSGVVYEGTSELDPYWPYAIRHSTQFQRLVPSLVKNADIVHVHGLWQLPGWMAAREAQRLHKPYVVMPHGFLEQERLKVSKWKKVALGTIMDRPMLKRAASIVATSESEAMGIRAYGIDRPIHIMPIGLDMGKYKLSNCSGKTLLYLSRITPIKGLDMLAEAWGAIDCKGWKLLIVGPDDRGYTEQIKRVFDMQCRPGSYEFRPPVFGPEKFDLLSSADAFVLPTRSENWSIAVAEAMASGLPVICTKGAPWACLNSEKAGWWVDIDAESIKSALESLIMTTPDDRKALGGRGRTWVERNLGWPSIARSMIEYYRNVIKTSES